MTDERVVNRVQVQPVAGELTRTAGRWVLTMTRVLRYPVAQVWPMLTEVGKLAEWAPMRPVVYLDRTGTIASADLERVDNYTVVAVDAPSEIRYLWGADELHWTLTPTATGCLLTIEHTFDDRDGCGSFGAGWHLCLAVLTLRLDGADVEPVVGERAMQYGWADLKTDYEAALG